MKSLLTGIFTIAMALGALAEVPSLINYQGKLHGLRSGGGTPTSKRSGEFKLKLFDQKTGGKLLYQEDIGNVTLDDGVYSFGFGESGHSILDFGESINVLEDGRQIFDYTLSKIPIAESVHIEADGYKWNEKAGSSDANNLLVQYNKNNKSAKIIFLNESPRKDTQIKINYRIKENRIISALASAQNIWIELTFRQYLNGIRYPFETLSPRERLVSVPFALTAKTVLNYPSFGARERVSVNQPMKLDSDGFLYVEGRGSFEATYTIDGNIEGWTASPAGNNWETSTIPIRKGGTLLVKRAINSNVYYMPITLQRTGPQQTSSSVGTSTKLFHFLISQTEKYEWRTAIPYSGTGEFLPFVHNFKSHYISELENQDPERFEIHVPNGTNALRVYIKCVMTGPINANQVTSKLGGGTNDILDRGNWENFGNRNLKIKMSIGGATQDIALKSKGNYADANFTFKNPPVGLSDIILKGSMELEDQKRYQVHVSHLIVYSGE